MPSELDEPRPPGPETVEKPKVPPTVIAVSLSEKVTDTAEQRSKKLGERLRGANMLVFGTVAAHSGCWELDVRLVEVASGAIAHACHGGCYRLEQLPSACNSIVNRLSGQPFRIVGPASPRAAVVLITDRSPDAKSGQIGSCFAAALTTALAQCHGVCVVERTWLKQILSERNLVSSDLVSANALELGKLFVADYLIVGDAGNDSLSVSLISVHGGGASLPLSGGGTVRFHPGRSFWEPAAKLADRVAEAIRAHHRLARLKETRR